MDGGEYAEYVRRMIAMWHGEEPWPAAELWNEMQGPPEGNPLIQMRVWIEGWEWAPPGGLWFRLAEPEP